MPAATSSTAATVHRFNHYGNRCRTPSRRRSQNAPSTHSVNRGSLSSPLYVGARRWTEYLHAVSLRGCPDLVHVGRILWDKTRSSAGSAAARMKHPTLQPGPQPRPDQPPDQVGSDQERGPGEEEGKHRRHRATPALSAHSAQIISPWKNVKSSWLPSTNTTSRGRGKPSPHPAQAYSRPRPA